MSNNRILRTNRKHGTKILLIFVLFPLFASFNIYAQVLPNFKVITPYYELYADSEIFFVDAQKEMDYCINEFRKYFRKEIITVALIISSSPELDSLELIPGKLGIKSKTYLMLGPSIIKGYKSNIISHEVAHTFLIAYANRHWKNLFKIDSVSDTKDVYGHSHIPDWIDEMVAILCENADLKRVRRTTMKDSIEKIIPLSELLRHRTYSSLFYNQILSVMEYIIENEGCEIVNTIVEESIKKRTMEEILKEYAKNIPSDLAALEKQWVEWVKRN